MISKQVLTYFSHAIRADDDGFLKNSTILGKVEGNKKELQQTWM